MKKVTIIINSCDKYYQAWEILAHSYRKYWKDCPWDILVMTNYLESPIGKSTNLKNVSNWSTMMRFTLYQAETPYVLLHLDDYFFTNYIDTNKLEDFVKIMERDEITHLRITPATDGIEDYPKDNRFKIIKKDSIYRTSLSPSIWNREHFLRFLSGTENTWQFETNGRFREQGEYLILSTKENCFPCVDRDNPDPKWHNLKSVEQGEWFDGARKYIIEEKLNIELLLNPKNISIENINENIKNQEKIHLIEPGKIKEPIKEVIIKKEPIILPIQEPIVSFPPLKQNTIKILWLYQYMEDVNYDHWFHIDFARAIFEHPKVDLRCYGFNMDKAYPRISLVYNENKLLADIKKEFDFDIIISNTKSRMFKYYVPPVLRQEERRDCWLPEDFSRWGKTPKISLEEDYHYEVSDSWYVENRIDLMLQRHWSQAQRKERIKKIWFPFSVDNRVFTPSKRPRVKKLCCIASSSQDCYPHRFKLIQMFEPYGLLFNAKRSIENNEYLEWLQRYVAYVSCDSIYHITPAKMFEIMASGGLLFTNNNNKYGINELFPKNTYMTYEEDYSDASKKVQLILNDKDSVNEIVENALNCIEKRHSNPIRINELLNIIKNEFQIF